MCNTVRGRANSTGVAEKNARTNSAEFTVRVRAGTSDSPTHWPISLFVRQKLAGVFIFTHLTSPISSPPVRDSCCMCNIISVAAVRRINARILPAFFSTSGSLFSQPLTNSAARASEKRPGCAPSPHWRRTGGGRAYNPLPDCRHKCRAADARTEALPGKFFTSALLCSTLGPLDRIHVAYAT